MAIFLKATNLSVNFKLNNMSLNEKLSGSLRLKNKEAVGGNVVSHKGKLFVEALKNISLDLKAGDRLGVVGKNGSGKSTLMRTLAGIIPPKSGLIKYEGNMLAAFSADGGIEQDLSVEENIFFRAALLGYQIPDNEKFIEEILDWAQVKQYRHLPFRTLSPGMMARVGFGLTTAFTTDILLIDEWIGVGDYQFVQRAKKRWENMVDRAGILIVCSHSEAIIQEYCNKILKLKRGMVEDFLRI